MIKVGDLVRQIDNRAGLSTGIIFRVLHVGEEFIDWKRNGRWTLISGSGKVPVRLIKLVPACIMFDSKPRKNRSRIKRYDYEVKVLDIVDIGLELNKLSSFLAEEAKKRSGDDQEFEQAC